MEQRYAIVKDNYVVNVVMWDTAATPDWVYPHPHDSVVLDTNENVGIGDWYEVAEGIFYRPLSDHPDRSQE